MVYFFTMKHMKTMKKKLQYLHALHGENKKHLLLKNFVFRYLNNMLKNSLSKGFKLTGKSTNTLFYQDLSTQCNRLINQLNQNSNATHQRMTFISDAVLAEQPLIDLINTPKDIHAVLDLWLQNSNFNDKQSITNDILQQIFSKQPQLSINSLHKLVQLFFKYFEDIEDIKFLAQSIQNQFNSLDEKYLLDNMKTWHQYRVQIFASDGPNNISESAKKNHCKLFSFAEQLAIPVITFNQYFLQCKHHYFIEAIIQSTTKKSFPILKESLEPRIHLGTDQNNHLFGQKLIMTLIEKTKDKKINMPEQWLQFLFDLTGDVRFPANTKYYNKWWRAINSTDIKKVKSWLCWTEMSMYYNLLIDHTHRHKDVKHHDDSLQSQYKFFKGLYDQQIVFDAKLFLGVEARQYLRLKPLPKYQLNQQPLTDLSQVLLYLKFADCHLILGCENPHLWIFKNLPDNNPIYNQNQKTRNAKEFGPEMAQHIHHNSPLPRRVKINSSSSWQLKSIEIFKDFGLIVDPKQILTHADYNLYRDAIGVDDDIWVD